MNTVKPYLLTAIAALGAAYCLVSMGGNSKSCVTAGCEIYSNYKILGLSFYAWGVAAFMLLALLAGPGCKPQIKQPLYAALCLMLITDTALLAYQSLFWPCSSCLIIASLVGLIAIAAYRIHEYCRTRTYRFLAYLWMALFLVVAAGVGKEAALKPWSLAGGAEAPVQVFFSPTCQACENVALQLLDGPDAGKVAFIPVAKTEEDARRIEAAVALGLEGDAAIRQLFQKEVAEQGMNAKIRGNLMRNKMAMAARGITKVPTIIAPFVPDRGVRLEGLSLSFLTFPGMPHAENPSEGACSVAVEAPCEGDKEKQTGK